MILQLRCPTNMHTLVYVLYFFIKDKDNNSYYIFVIVNL